MSVSKITKVKTIEALMQWHKDESARFKSLKDDHIEFAHTDEAKRWDLTSAYEGRAHEYKNMEEFHIRACDMIQQAIKGSAE